MVWIAAVWMRCQLLLVPAHGDCLAPEFFRFEIVHYLAALSRWPTRISIDSGIGLLPCSHALTAEDDMPMAVANCG